MTDHTRPPGAMRLPRPTDPTRLPRPSDPDDPPLQHRGPTGRRRRPDLPAAAAGESVGGGLPDPIGDVVPGDPPVPITVWHLPRPRAGQLVSVDMVRRLIGNHTRPGGLVVDLTTVGQLPPAGRPVALVITGCPQPPDAVPAHLAGCAASLHPGGCLAVVLPATRTPGQLGQVVAAGRAAGLTYLQHIVIAHHLTPPALTADGPRRAHPATGQGRPHPRVHTDVLVLRAPDISGSPADA